MGEDGKERSGEKSSKSRMIFEEFEFRGICHLISVWE